jgi:hypothetical protein
VSTFVGVGLLPVLWCVWLFFAHRANGAVFALRPDLLAIPRREARRRIRAQRRGPQAGDRQPSDTGRHRLTGSSSAGPRPLPADLLAHHWPRQAAILRARLRENVVLRLLTVLITVFVALRLIGLVRDLQGQSQPLPDQLMPLMAVCFVGLLVLTLYVERQRTREHRMEPFGLGQGRHGFSPPQSLAPSRFTTDQGQAVRSMVTMLGSALPASPLSRLASVPTALTAAHYFSPTVTTGTLVADPVERTTTVAAYHRLALATLPRPLPPSFYLMIVPRGLSPLPFADRPVESDTFNQRFDTVTRDGRLSHALLTPRTLETLLALPDEVCVVVTAQHILALGLLPMPEGVEPLLASAVEQIAFTVPEWTSSRLVLRPQSEPWRGPGRPEG